ncbi:MAG: glycosyl hydrolase [Vicinamibacterales bacterium]
MPMIRSVAVLLVVGGLAVAPAIAARQTATSAPPFGADLFRDLAVRAIGPAVVSGRIADVQIDPRNPSVWYVASAFGGLWKTENRGITFTPIFDSGGSFTLCCVAIDPHDSNVIWLGTGENSSQRSAQFGDGIYKSVDAGKSWTRMGLVESEHIGRILIDPRDSRVVYVAAQGSVFKAGGDRGVFRTTDSGHSWERVLFISDDTGVSDLAFDPKDADVVYAGTYQRRRHVGQMVGGGPEGGIFKTTDAGRHWTKLTRGLPPGEVGRIALATDPKAPDRVYALIDARGTPGGDEDALAPGRYPPPPTEHDAVGFYRSEDRGRTWTRVSRYRGGGSAYYGEIFVDPRSRNTLWSVSTTLEWTRDAGRTWMDIGVERGTGADAVHVDHHAVAFDPSNPNHIVIGNDGGLYETYDNTRTWRFFANLPVSQFYRISVGNEQPFYTVCGGTQDNFSLCAPSRTTHALGIRSSDWTIIAGGDGLTARHDPVDPNIVYGSAQEGGVARFDRRTGRNTVIKPPQSRGGPEGAGADTPQSAPDRINWDAPFITSAHATKRLYWASNYLYRSDDRGDTWRRISPDLTRNLDWRTLPIMGRVWPADAIALHESTTTLSTIVALDESPIVDGLLYIGTDDGLVQVTENGGLDWRRVDRFPGVPAGTYVSDIFASRREADTVFVAFNNWQTGDYRPYVLKSSDRGRTWTEITGDLPDRHDVWAIAQDSEQPRLLFAGTEFGAFFTIDEGTHWTKIVGGMPPAQVRDLQLQPRDSDLVMGTFGRGVYVLDDYGALRDLSAATLSEAAHLFPLRDAYSFVPWGLVPDGSSGQAQMAGNLAFPNPAVGALFTYHVQQAAPGRQLVLIITDDSGKEMRRLELPTTAGLRRVTWDLRADADILPAPDAEAEAEEALREADPDEVQRSPAPSRRRVGALVVPGVYHAALAFERGDVTERIGPEQTFHVKALPERDYATYP